jgi:branched-chain amino acid transport system substrate-binding protein
MEQNNSKAWWWVAGLIVVAVLVYLGVTVSPSPVAGQTVKIGFVAPLSGDAGSLGIEMQKVVSYLAEQINAKAGDNGTKFEIIYEDGKCSGNDAVSAFQKLATIDGVKFIIGGLCSSETMNMAPLADQNKVVMIAPASSNPKIEGIGKYTFSLSYSDKKTGEDLAKEMSAYKKVAIMSEQNEFNIGIRDTVIEDLKKYPSVTVVANETFPKGASDFRSVLEKVRQSAPEAILLNPNPGVSAQSLIRQMAEMKNWTGYKLFGQVAYLVDPGRAPAGDFSEGMIVIDSPSIDSPEFRAMKDEILNARGGTFDNLGNFYAASSMDAINLMTALIVKNGNDPEKVRNELSTGKFKGYIGNIEFSGHNFVRLALSGKYLIQNGKALLQSEQ